LPSLHRLIDRLAVPDLGEGPGGPGPRPPTNRGLPPNPSIFGQRYVSLVILTEDFEINETLCKPVQCTNSSQNAPELAIYRVLHKSKKISGEAPDPFPRWGGYQSEDLIGCSTVGWSKANTII